MANIAYHNGEFVEIRPKRLDLVKQDAHTAVYEDRVTHNQIILKGSGFTFDGHELTAGQMTSLKIVSGVDGHASVTVDHADLNAALVAEQLIHRDSAHFNQVLTKGDDILTGAAHGEFLRGGAGDDVIDGNGGGDVIEGASGTDTLTGGVGSDYFMFKAGSGADVITDFDADGGGKHQDYISSTVEAVSITNHHGDTVVDFGDGDTLTLLHVKASHVTVDDFKAFHF